MAVMPAAIEHHQHRGPGGWWHVAMQRPGYALREAVVGSFVEWREEAAAPTRRCEVAGTLVPFIVNFDAPYRLATHQPLGEWRSFTTGLFDTPVTVHGARSAHAVQVNLTPLAARALFGCPLHELSNQAVGIDDLLGREGRALQERLGNASDTSARLALLATFVHERVHGAKPISRVVQWVWDELVASHGQVRIERLQRACGWSAARLGAAMRDACGFTPRRLGSLLRFEQLQRDARAQHARGARVQWSALAAMRGYADQAHLIREFQRFAGESPSAWMARLHEASPSVLER